LRAHTLQWSSGRLNQRGFGLVGGALTGRQGLVIVGACHDARPKGGNKVQKKSQGPLVLETTKRKKRGVR